MYQRQSLMPMAYFDAVRSFSIMIFISATDSGLSKIPLDVLLSGVHKCYRRSAMRPYSNIVK